MLPSLGWMILGPLQEQQATDTDGDVDDVDEDDDVVVADIVVASLNSTIEEYNHWVWFGLPSRNPNPSLGCEFYYYRNATNASSSLWCLEDLYKQPNMPSPSIYPHLYSPAIVKLQNATPCSSGSVGSSSRPLVWMPLNFFVWTYNVFALTSVVSGVYGPDGSCQGLAAANVRFSSMSKYLSSLVGSARYEDLNIVLIETTSGKILGTSLLGSATYKENQTRSDGSIVEQELAASLGQMENNKLAEDLNSYIESSYGTIDMIPSPMVSSTILDGQDYFVSFDTFTRPNLNLTICAFLPHVSITGPTETQRFNAMIALDVSEEELQHRVNLRLITQIGIGVGGLLLLAVVASITAAYLSLRIQALVNFMELLRGQISTLVDRDSSRRSSTTTNLCKPLPKDFFPVFETTSLVDLNKIRDATEHLCCQLLETWNNKQEVFRRALEQRHFTASIAHDIRNPLHGVLGIVSMMQSDVEAHKDKLPLLADTLGHMAILLNDMVDLSKIQGGKVTHIKKRFDVWDVLQEILTLYKSTVVSGGGTLSCMDKPPVSLFAYSDPIHVKRIMTNFVSNASKYATGCPITLNAIRATKDQVQNLSFLKQLDSRFGDSAPTWSRNAILDDDQYIVLTCHDKGRGIPSTKLHTVFDAYQQTHTSDRYQGAGLGLAIVKGLAVELGGGVGVQSQVNSGSLFWLAIPCSPSQFSSVPLLPPSPIEAINNSETITPIVDTATTVTVAPSISSLEGCNVLVIDDTNLNLMLLKHFLTRLKMKPETSTTATDGLKKLRQDPKKFSLILSDFHMPEMSGGEMCLEVRNDPQTSHLPFICTSGNHLTDEEKTMYQIDDTLMKPFTIDQLKEVIIRYIHRPSTWSSFDSSKGPKKHGITTPADETETTEQLSDQS